MRAARILSVILVALVFAIWVLSMRFRLTIEFPEWEVSIEDGRLWLYLSGADATLIAWWEKISID